MDPTVYMLMYISVLTITDAIKPQLADFWNNQAQEELKRFLSEKRNTNVAKNVILFVGDGMGISTVTAARILKGQQNGKTGEETILSFEKFQHIALSKTYNTDYMVSDSAGTATAFLSGIKTKGGVVGVDDRIVRSNCSTEDGADVDSIVHWSEKEGKSTGVVTTTRITHATPAAAYAHSVSRDWESDADINHPLFGDLTADGKCHDIARQLIEKNSNIEVILGGGRTKLLPNTTADPEYPSKYGSRTDGRNLIEEWIKKKQNQSASYVWNNTEFQKVNPASTDFLLGLFEPSHMQYSEDRGNDIAGEPSLAEMTEKAIKILKKNKNGYFLLVEGGRIDHGHHGGLAKYALTDTIAFDESIERALNLTNDEETLVIVTADHSHTLTIGGYTSRGKPLFGKADFPYIQPLDDKPYTTLLYANGPGYAIKNGTREDITNIDTGSKSYKQQAAVPLRSETHGGEEVAIYANGPMAHLFSGVHEQNYIAHVMAYASCVGANKDHCKRISPTTVPCNTNTASSLSIRCSIIYFTLFLVVSYILY